MSINKYTSDFSLYLLSIKQAFESGTFSKEDCATLMVFFQQGVFYRSILDHDALCEGAVLNGIAEFCKLVENNIPAPDVTGDLVMSFELREGKAGLAVSQQLPVELRQRAEQVYRVVMVGLLAVFQVAILSLSRHLRDAQDLTSTDVTNTHYVIGMAELSAVNIGDLMETEAHFGDSNHERIQQSFMGLIRFAATLKQSSEELVVAL